MSEAMPVPTIATLVTMRDALVENVRSLAADVAVLYEAERWPRACALAILCAEEFSKLIAIDHNLAEARAGRDIQWAELQKEMRSHEIKLVPLAQVLLVARDSLLSMFADVQAITRDPATVAQEISSRLQRASDRVRTDPAALPEAIKVLGQEHPELAATTKLLNRLKQNAIYVGLENGVVSQPNIAISHEVAEVAKLVTHALERLASGHPWS